MPEPSCPEDGAVLALGLDRREAAVLRAVWSAADTSPAALAALTGLARPRVSEALQSLERWGLVEVSRTRRPHLVALVRDVEPAIRALLERAEADARRSRQQAREGAALLRTRAADLARVPRAPAQRPRERGLGPAADHHLLLARSRYDEVARLDGTTVRFGGRVHPGTVVRRVLVLGEPPSGRRRWWERHGVQVRCAAAELPVLVLVDGVRARVEVGSSAPGRTGWTSDPAQVRALQQLFDLWWVGAAGS